VVTPVVTLFKSLPVRTTGNPATRRWWQQEGTIDLVEPLRSSMFLNLEVAAIDAIESELREVNRASARRSALSNARAVTLRRLTVQERLVLFGS
jgi:hypothetical protein